MPDPWTQAVHAFRGCPEKHALAPLWYWNDDLREDEIRRQLKQLKAQHVTQPMVFPMAGLVQPYLSPDYFSAFRFAVKEARRLDMKLWVYDEYCWPSGLAGGQLNERYPDYLMTALRVYRLPVDKGTTRDVVRTLPDGRLLRAEAVRRSDGKRLDITDAARGGTLRWRAPGGAWDVRLFVIFRVDRRLDTVTGARWTGEQPGYLDAMNPEAVAAYIELVYEGHYQAVPGEFGRTVPGFFTDEPSIAYDTKISGGRSALDFGHKRDNRVAAEALRHPDEPNLFGFVTSLPWTKNFLHTFRERHGYDLWPRLGELADGPRGDRRVMYDYFKLISDLFAEAYCEQIGRWCSEHKVSFTGHYGEGTSQGDHYRQTAPQQVPGMDLLGDMHRTRDTVILPKRIAAVARAHGRDRVLSETFAGLGWHHVLAERIRYTDYLALAGINLFSPIDYAYSFRSFRKHTANPPGFLQAPFWPYQKHFSDRIARLSSITSAGKAAVEAAILYPSVQVMSDALADAQRTAAAEERVTKALRDAMRLQVETDVLYETALPEARVNRGRLVYPGTRYRMVILPAISRLAADTVDILARFVKQGGTAVFLDTVPMLGPRGESLKAAMKKHFGLSTATAQRATVLDRPCGKGRVLFVPDPTREIRISGACASGEKLNLFDGTDSMVALGQTYPQWLAVDLGETTAIRSIAMTHEKIKAGITYTYNVQTSPNGKTWKTVATASMKGRRQVIDLGKVSTRWLRLMVREGERFFALHHLDITVADKQGSDVLWRPRLAARNDLEPVLAELRPGVTFHEIDTGAFCSDVFLRTRSCEGREIVGVCNDTDRERTLVARLKRQDRALLHADPDTGRMARLATAHNDKQSVPITFAPYQTRVVVVDKPGASGRRQRLQADTRALTVQRLRGPWRFQTEKPNALPLSACNLELADPARPDAWLPAEQGAMPAPLLLVPALRFRVNVDMNVVPSNTMLVFDEGLVRELEINGQCVAQNSRRFRYYDVFQRAVPVAKRLKRGRNRIQGLWMPEMYERTTRGSVYRYPRLQPTFDALLAGDFSVDATARIVRPRTRLNDRAWETQGYPFYSGTATYTLTFTRPKGDGPWWLEVHPRDGVAEVRCGTRKIGARAVAPYLFDLSKALRSGKNTVQVSVTNSLATLFQAQRGGSLGNTAPVLHSGLASARLVTPRNAPRGAAGHGVRYLLDQ